MADTLGKEIIKEICATGDKTGTIPDTTQSGSNALSYADGFPIATSTPQSDGGIPPKRTDMNKVLNMLSKNQVFLQNGGSYSYDSSVVTAIGGYPKGARFLYANSTNQKFYIESLKNNNSDVPSEENICYKTNTLTINGVVGAVTDLPTPTEGTLGDIYLLSSGTTFFVGSGQDGNYGWAEFPASSIGSGNDVIYAKYNKDYYIYDGTSAYSKLDNTYSCLAVNSLAHNPMPDYSLISSETTDVEHTATRDIFVMVHLEAQDKDTPAKFLIGSGIGETANIEIASWSIMGANSRADWFIPVPKGFKWKVVKGNITTVTVRKVYIQ